VPAARLRTLQQGLLKMSHEAADADALSQLRLKGFVAPELPAHSSSP
jgi:hypothetical protein